VFLEDTSLRIGVLKKIRQPFSKQGNTIAVDKSHCVVQNQREKPLATAMSLLTLKVQPALFAVKGFEFFLSSLVCVALIL